MGHHDDIVIDANHSRADKMVLEQLCRDISATKEGEDASASSKTTLETLKALNNPQDARFEPTVFTTWDMDDIRSSPRVPGFLLRLLEEYITWGRTVARNETDVVMVTHLLLYFCTSIPSAIILFTRFSYLHAFGHIAMQFYYMGPYTLLKHQHIHQRGVLAKRFGAIDNLFPYAMDLFMGHTWNSYFYHHVKHHHVEGNGPDDMSSTIRYQRDSVVDFSIYIGRFLFFVWVDLPRYFLTKGKYVLGAKAAFWELGAYAFYYSMFQINSRAASFVFLVPLCVMRIAMMVGNWGQHAFVDADEPDSDYRSSITVIDVPVRFPLLDFYLGLLFLQNVTPADMSNSPLLEQPILLQRRVPYLAPPQPDAALA